MPLYTAMGVDIRIEEHPQVYPPAEDTFLLAGALGPVGGRALDLGTGSGFLAVLCARLGARVVATDINPYALRLARSNAAHNGVAIEPVRCDLLEALCGTFDLVVFNPPYLPTAPEDLTHDRWLDASVDGGPDGLGPVSRFLAGLASHLAPGGRAYTLVSSLSGKRPRPPPNLTLRPVATLELEFELLTVLEAQRTRDVARRAADRSSGRPGTNNP